VSVEAPLPDELARFLQACRAHAAASADEHE
jgi:hypothetical protein